MRLLRTMPDRVMSLLPNGLLKELQEDEDKNRGKKTKQNHVTFPGSAYRTYYLGLIIRVTL